MRATSTTALIPFTEEGRAHRGAHRLGAGRPRAYCVGGERLITPHLAGDARDRLHQCGAGRGRLRPAAGREQIHVNAANHAAWTPSPSCTRCRRRVRWHPRGRPLAGARPAGGYPRRGGDRLVWSLPRRHRHAGAHPVGARFSTSRRCWSCSRKSTPSERWWTPRWPKERLRVSPDRPARAAAGDSRQTRSGVPNFRAGRATASRLPRTVLQHPRIWSAVPSCAARNSGKPAGKRCPRFPRTLLSHAALPELGRNSSTGSTRAHAAAFSARAGAHERIELALALTRPIRAGGRRFRR